jgi:hypothetical protein
MKRSQKIFTFVKTVIFLNIGEIVKITPFHDLEFFDPLKTFLSQYEKFDRHSKKSSFSSEKKSRLISHAEKLVFPNFLFLLLARPLPPRKREIEEPHSSE